MSKIDTEYITKVARQTILRVDACLAELGRNAFLGSYPTLKRESSKLTCDENLKYAMNDASVEVDNIDEGPSGRYEKALVILGDYRILQTLMDLCITEYLYPEFTTYIKNGFGYDICIYIAALIEEK